MKRLEKVVFSLAPEAVPCKIENAGIVGSFLFYESELTGHTCETGMGGDPKFYNPHQYRDGMEFIGMRYYEEMRFDEQTGRYTVEFLLPPGLYLYRFAVNAQVVDGMPDFRSGQQGAVLADGRIHAFSRDTLFFADPENPARIPTVSGKQDDSVLAVGTDADLPWLPGVPADKRGDVSYMSYTDIDGLPQSLGVYLPAGFSREKTYPVIFVSHGGGGNEADWYHAGGIHNIMDKLIAEGRTAEAVLVTMNNTVYQWDFEKIARNMEECVIPFVRRVLPVSAEPWDNAFCGLSMGSMTTLYMYMHHNAAYRYFGAFSGGIAGGEHFSLEDPALFDRVLMIGCGEKDIAWNFREIGVPPTIEALKKKGLPFIPYFVPGGHDWYCWPQMFTEFAEHVLWKKKEG